MERRSPRTCHSGRLQQKRGDVAAAAVVAVDIVAAVVARIAGTVDVDGAEDLLTNQ